MSSDRYWLLLRLVDTRDAGPDFPDMLGRRLRQDRIAELGLPEATRVEVNELRTLRDGLIPVVFGGRDEAIAALNGQLSKWRAVPQVDADARRLVLLPSRRGRVAALASEVLGQAVDLYLTGDDARISVCAADACAAPFVDDGRRRPRRYCSDRCATRMRVRNHRAKGAADRGTA